MRLGFETSDLARNYDAPDVLFEIEAFYRQAMLLPPIPDGDDDGDDNNSSTTSGTADSAKKANDFKLTVVPIVPHTARDVVTIRDFVSVRGWYSMLDSRDLELGSIVAPANTSTSEIDSLKAQLQAKQDTIEQLQAQVQALQSQLQQQPEQQQADQACEANGSDAACPQ
jgi:uncharacterized coiled-coil protein SlyX